MSTQAFRLPFRLAGEQLGWGLALSLGLHLFLAAGVLFWPDFSSRRRVFVPVYQVQLVGAPAFSAPPAPGPAVQAAPPKPAPRPEPPKAAPKPEPPKPAPQPEPPKAEPKPEPPKPAPKPAPKPEPAKEAIGEKKTAPPAPKPAPKPEPQEDSKALEQLESKIRNLQAKVSEENRLDSALGRLQNKLAAKVAQEPRAGAGGAPGGTAPAAGAAALGAGDARFQLYHAELWSRVQRHWTLPEAMVARQKGLEALVLLRISREGALEKVWLEKGSGNARYDQSCLRAVERAAPFPRLPAEYRGGVYEVGLRFRPEDLT